ncbi:MAG: hypothetical protein UHJ46_08610 [Treponema sp.]|nr:hypothetical protein [Treponema sp.]
MFLQIVPVQNYHTHQYNKKAIFSTESGIFTSFNDAHPLNAFPDKYSTVEGNEIETSALQFLNSGIAFIPSGMITVLSLSQLLNDGRLFIGIPLPVSELLYAL